MIPVAALFVDPRGVYACIPGVEPWGLPDRDARGYPTEERADDPALCHPVVAHPPCASWGRYAKPHPASRARGPLLGDDGGCFAVALASVKVFGGVLEHPRDTKAWARFDLTRPTPGGGWTSRPDEPGVWTCEVDQGHYGHAARKPTWLYYVGPCPPELTWGPSNPPPVGTGARRGNLESLSKRQRAATPRPFADLLVSLARASRG